MRYDVSVLDGGSLYTATETEECLTHVCNGVEQREVRAAHVGIRYPGVEAAQRCEHERRCEGRHQPRGRQQRKPPGVVRQGRRARGEEEHLQCMGLSSRRPTCTLALPVNSVCILEVYTAKEAALF